MMLGASAVPGLLLFVVALVAPKSPRWLMMMRRRPEAAAELRKIRPGADVEPRLDAIEAALRQEGDRASWGEVFHQEWRRPLMIGLGLAVFQQITGINAIIYYADQIFSSAGFATPAAQTTVTTWAIGAVNVLATLIAIAFIDRLGRRKLLLAGLIGMGISLIVVGVAFQFLSSKRTIQSSSPGQGSIARTFASRSLCRSAQLKRADKEVSTSSSLARGRRRCLFRTFMSSSQTPWRREDVVDETAMPRGDPNAHRGYTGN